MFTRSFLYKSSSELFMPSMSSGVINISSIRLVDRSLCDMIGVKNTHEYKDALNAVLQVQDSLLRQYIHPDSKKIPQQFVPYKEVLDVYRAGLEVPDHITLVWPDDNLSLIHI